MKYEPICGESINTCARKMIQAVVYHNEEATAEFNGVILRATIEHTVQEIIDYYDAETKRRHEEYINSPEGKKAAIRQKKAQERADAARAEGIKPFSVKDVEFWEKQIEVNQDGYGSCVIRYAARWANLMEDRMKNGGKLESIADATSCEADAEGITGFMYGCAVSILSKVWEHGEALRKWHNLKTQIGNEGEAANESGGVLNPAIITIGGNSRKPKPRKKGK